MAQRSNFSLQSSIFLLLTMLTLAECQNTTPPLNILNTSQYHFIPNGSYLQYAFTSMNLQESLYNETLSEFIITIWFDIYHQYTNPVYNMLVFPQVSETAQDLFQSFKKASGEGLSDLMQQFSLNYTAPQTPCSVCYQLALYAQQPIACLNCTQINFGINLTSARWEQLSSWNNSVLTIVDNTQVVSQTGGYFQLLMSFGIEVGYDEEYQALFILYFAVVSALIIILAILAVFLTLKINKVQKQIQECKEKTKVE